MTNQQSTLTSTHRWLITISVMLTAILEVLDSTIVNVALPHMMGSLGANTHQITWVLTAYIVSSAIFIPLTGFLVARLGRKRLLMINVTGFMLSSALCGLSTSLEMIIVFRVLQGMFGAALIPVSQYVLLDTFSAKEQSKAMAIWGIGIMAAPAFGPTLGGFITESINWRWIFYINVPVCLISLGMITFAIKETKRVKQPIDWFTLLLMALGTGSLQIFLDQGNQRDWFSSGLIFWMAITAVITLTLFVTRALKSKAPAVNIRLFTDRNFMLSTLILALYSGAMFSSIALEPLMLEHLMHYPAIQTGMIMSPIGIASAIGMAMTPALMKIIDSKYLLTIGIITSAIGTFLLSQYNLDVSLANMILPAIIQGLGLGLMIVPLSLTVYLTLPESAIPEGAGLFGYGRMLGTSIGISLLSTFVTRQTQINWNRLGGFIHPFNPHLAFWLSSHHTTLLNRGAIMGLAGQVGQQANMIAFINAYTMIAIGLLALLPLVWFLRGTEKLKTAQPNMMH